ncbi:MAG TPA: hypothetical protein VFE10_00580 [Phenylobacterium sp.]|jgi:hypothetical protein|nr:hypothetical protein [Phenylobacterium sp.]
MDIDFTINDNGKLVAEIKIGSDGKVLVTTAGKLSADAAAVGSAQYVWGTTNVAEAGRPTPSVTLEIGQAAPGADLGDGEVRVDGGIGT